MEVVNESMHFETLMDIKRMPIIEIVCLPGTIIYSDGWKAYRRIRQKLGFEHRVVNRNRHFVCPITGVHTQGIESYWNKMKGSIKKSMALAKNSCQDY